MNEGMHFCSNRGRVLYCKLSLKVAAEQMHDTLMLEEVEVLPSCLGS